MQNISIYIDREDYKTAPEEERHRFMRLCLSSIELQGFDSLWPEDSVLSAAEKRKLRDFLASHNVDIIENVDGETRIFYKDDLIAYWLPPTFILRQDFKAKQRSKMFFFEMKLSFWSAWDDIQETNEKS